MAFMDYMRAASQYSGMGIANTANFMGSVAPSWAQGAISKTMGFGMRHPMITGALGVGVGGTLAGGAVGALSPWGTTSGGMEGVWSGGMSGGIMGAAAGVGAFYGAPKMGWEGISKFASEGPIARWGGGGALGAGLKFAAIGAAAGALFGAALGSNEPYIKI